MCSSRELCNLPFQESKKGSCIHAKTVFGPMSEIPKEAKLVSILLKSIGVDECEPKVIQQLLELVYRHSTQVLQDAQLFAEHAAKTNIELDDVRLALQSRVNYSFIPPPPREFLVDLAAKRNSIPLPIIDEDVIGLKLPDEDDCLLNANYKITATSAAAKKTKPELKRKLEE